VDNADDKHQRSAEKRNAGYEKKQAKATTEKGLVIVNTGTGKGKSTAAFGMALRAVGHGMKVGVVQFIKGAMATAERDLLDAYEQVEFHTLGDGFTWKTQDRQKDVESAERAWAVAARLLADESVSVVVLDELNWALKYEYVQLDAVLAALAARPAMQHVVITGRNAPDGLVPSTPVDNTADTVPAGVLMRLFSPGPVRADWLSENFQQAITADQLTELRDDLAAQLGALEAIEPGEGVWLMTFENGVLPVFLRLNPAGEIDTLWFNPIEPQGPLDADQIRELMAGFDGEVAVLVEREGEVLLAQQADTPLAVGSAFKLTVLQALRAAMAAGDIADDEELELIASRKSLPSGRLQDEADGSRWRVDELARRMIAQSDNTATDMLINRVGRAPLDSEPGVINQSFLLEDLGGRRSCVVATWNHPDGMVTIPFLNLVSHFARLARTAD